jgi:hypothetical protein
VAAGKNYNLIAYQRWQNQQYPNELHNAGGDCENPQCDYEFTPEDEQHIQQFSGWFTCPKCGLSFNYLDGDPRKKTRAGLTMDEMGQLGETIIAEMGHIPGVGDVKQIFGVKNHPIDAIIGPYGAEIKTNHSEAQPRFKMGGERVLWEGQYLRPAQVKTLYTEQQGLRPLLVGVRLNFYSSMADIFWREGFSDTWIGGKTLNHAGTEDFSHLNPFKTAVPPAALLPEDDETPAVDSIPF